MSKQTEKALEDASAFVPLLDGAEKPEFVRLREEAFQESWAKVHGRIGVCAPGVSFYGGSNQC